MAGCEYTLDDASRTVGIAADDTPALAGTRQAALDGLKGTAHVANTDVTRWKRVMLALGGDVPGFGGPEVNVTAAAGGTEGVDATFTLTANPMPTSDLDVSVTVAATGDYGVTPGVRTAAIPSTGSATLTVATTDDSADEADGSATATLNGGNGYTVSSSQGLAKVSIADDDDSPHGNSDALTGLVEDAETVSRGEALVFTISASETAQQEVVVSYSLSNNKGMIAGLDYCALPADFRCEDLGLAWDHDDTVGEVTIAEGEDTATLSIWVAADAWVPGKAWIFVRLTEVEGAKEISKVFAQGQINE